MQFNKGRPRTNAERQQAWRDKHRPARQRGVVFMAPPQAPALPPPPQATPPELMGPEALFENYIRKMQPAKKLYLAMLIMDDLNALCGKRKARRNSQYVVQALTYANELAALPEPEPEVAGQEQAAMEGKLDQPLLEE